MSQPRNNAPRTPFEFSKHRKDREAKGESVGKNHVRPSTVNGNRRRNEDFALSQTLSAISVGARQKIIERLTQTMVAKFGS
jgi:hypothetical protein